MKNVFKKIKNNIEKGGAEISSVIIVQKINEEINQLSKLMRLFLCNSNTGLKWQRGYMVR